MSDAQFHSVLFIVSMWGVMNMAITALWAHTVMRHIDKRMK